MPLAITAVSAAASAARFNGQTSQRETDVATQVPETMAMPIPRSNAEQSDPNLRSRAYLHAQTSQSQGQGGISSARSSRSFSGQTIPLSQRSSQESVQTQSSGSGFRRASKSDMGSFEQIQRDEASGAPEDLQRPDMANRKSSWFSGWGGTPEKPKTE
jgi:receptor expression-enhancing protein 1/2/3/4